MTQPSNIIEIHDLYFAYGRQTVLEGIELNVPAGSALGVIGPNGGGKTTLLHLLLGLLKPERGSITIDSLTPAQAVAKGDRVGFLPQRWTIPNRFPLNVRQAVCLGLVGKTGLFKTHSPEDLAHVDRLLDLVGLKDLRDRPVGTLSGGQLQRVFLARSLANRPRLLLLDEPTTGIDLSGQKRFIEVLATLRREMNLSIVFISHDLRAVTTLCDRIACLDVRLHYHDVPQHLPPELVYRMFSCDLEAIGLQGAPTISPATCDTQCSCPAHDHTHAHVTPTEHPVQTP